jgi:transcriptional regulator with XRE-family HTH domain
MDNNMLFDFELFRLLRQKEGIKRSDFAHGLGVSDDRLYRFESGQSQPCISLIDKMARSFGLPAEALLRREDEPSNSEEIKKHS